MKGYSTLSYDTGEFDFVKVMSDLFDIGRLNQIHSLLDRAYMETFEVGKDSSTNLHKKFYDKYRSGWPEMVDLYERFIKDFVSKLYSDDFLYQSFVTVRFHIPGNIAVGGFHNDMEYHHPDGEINFIIPLTDSEKTASCWVESGPGRKDFKPMKMTVGKLILFNGNKLTHGNKVNKTAKTRVSMDFRVLPIDRYNPDESEGSMTLGTKFIEGKYYKRFSR